MEKAMLAGVFHAGSGLGDQLHRYITVRTLAEEKGYTWGMKHPDRFKGRGFMRLDIGVPFNMKSNANIWNEKEIRDRDDVDIRSYDPEINFIEDNTIIDGTFEDFKYWGHNLDNIRKWLTVEPAAPMLPNTVVIGFRGGEYATVPDLLLPDEYWRKALSRFPKDSVFQVHTDDVALAQKTLRRCGLELASYTQDIGLNWRAVRYAPNLIIANSAFYILPALLNEKVKNIVAPRYWARYNTRCWARPATFYPQFTYIHHDKT